MRQHPALEAYKREIREDYWGWCITLAVCAIIVCGLCAWSIRKTNAEYDKISAALDAAMEELSRRDASDLMR